MFLDGFEGYRNFTGELCKRVSEHRRTLETRHVTFIENCFSLACNVPSHYHERPFLSFSLNSSFEETCGRHHKLIEPLTITYHPSGRVHQNRILSDGVQFIHVTLKDSLFSQLKLRLRHVENLPHLLTGDFQRICLNLYREYRNFDQFSDLIIESNIYGLFAQACRFSQQSAGWKKPAWLKRIVARISERHIGTYSLHKLAEEVSVHPAHLARVFKENHGCSIGHYVRKLKVQDACKMLGQRDMKISEIAAATGFADQSHFTKVFKMHLGVTPLVYRRLLFAGSHTSKQ